MDRDRLDGAAKTGSRKAKESVGNLAADQKTVAEGQAEQKADAVQNAIGGLGTPFAMSESRSSALPFSSGETLATWRALAGLRSSQG